MTIEILPQKFTICKVPVLSANMLEEEFCFIGKTDRELSLVCWTDHVPKNTTGREDGWRGIRIAGHAGVYAGGNPVQNLGDISLGANWDLCGFHL